MHALGFSERFYDKGFTIEEDLYSKNEVQFILQLLDKNMSTFPNQHTCRHLLEKVPELASIVLKPSIKDKIQNILGLDAFLTKSILFNKTVDYNWAVPFHQDLSINVKNRVEVGEFKNWISKENGFNVQPPLQYLKSCVTLRIHLDDTTEKNGALKVLPGTHKLGIKREITSTETSCFCLVKRGGALFMSPLLFHASSKSELKTNRRVIHLEFSSMELPKGLEWSEHKSMT